jgi:hypothetical protein
MPVKPNRPDLAPWCQGAPVRGSTFDGCPAEGSASLPIPTAYLITGSEHARRAIAFAFQ